ncbi:MAG: hypothetical protein HWE27_07680 [Gammaproteobacteria bacterium]|nr:hypothetical protein [Gammaproteobacteria bacterium]
MEGTLQLKVIGMDPNRPPVIRKEPYIELYFKLNAKAPIQWLKSFVDLVSNGPYPIKMKPAESDIIGTWVRTPAEVEAAFHYIKSQVIANTDHLNKRLLAQKSAEQALANGIVLTPEQIELNTIVANLDFDKAD